jgi:hypothetical protein
LIAPMTVYGKQIAEAYAEVRERMMAEGLPVRGQDPDEVVSRMTNELRERVVELTTICNARLGDCVMRIKEVEARLAKLKEPLESKSPEELDRVMYILDLIKKDQARKRKARRVT